MTEHKYNMEEYRERLLKIKENSNTEFNKELKIFEDYVFCWITNSIDKKLNENLENLENTKKIEIYEDFYYKAFSFLENETMENKILNKKLFRLKKKFKHRLVDRYNVRCRVGVLVGSLNRKDDHVRVSVKLYLLEDIDDTNN